MGKHLRSLQIARHDPNSTLHEGLPAIRRGRRPVPNMETPNWPKSWLLIVNGQNACPPSSSLTFWVPIKKTFAGSVVRWASFGWSKARSCSMPQRAGHRYQGLISWRFCTGQLCQILSHSCLILLKCWNFPFWARSHACIECRCSNSWFPTLKLSHMIKPSKYCIDHGSIPFSTGLVYAKVQPAWIYSYTQAVKSSSRKKHSTAKSRYASRSADPSLSNWQVPKQLCGRLRTFWSELHFGRPNKGLSEFLRQAEASFTYLAPGWLPG